MLLEYCPGGTVRNLIEKSAKGYLSEQDTRKILKDVIYGVAYLHKNHILHRDLKVTNYMIGSDGNAKIVDFGLSNYLKNEKEKRFTICGTPAYRSPELIQHQNNGYGYEVDIWAVGVSAFSMLTGHHPFKGGKNEIIYENIRNCAYKFPTNIPISSEAKNFIMTIFKVDPKCRPSAFALSSHPFLASDDIILQPNNDSIQTNINKVNQNKNQSNIPTSIHLHEHITPNEDAKPQNEEKIEDEKDIFNNIQKNQSNFKIPNYFVSEYLLHDQDLRYLLLDGTVGACFEDQSRMIMDPNEKFIQYYKNYDCYPKLINPDEYLDKKTKLSKKIKLVKKFAKKIKKVKSSYELQDEDYDSSIPLYHVKYFLSKDSNIIFRFNDKSAQVNFIDLTKLAIFPDKKMCIFKNFTDKCNLLSLSEVSSMPEESEEHKKLLIANEYLKLIFNIN